MENIVIGVILWRLLHENWLDELETNGSAGHDFENQIVQRVFLAVSKQGGYKTSPPRTTLKLRTVSGLSHQIDVIVAEGVSTYHLIECKFTKLAGIEEMYALNAKLLDYAFGALGAQQKSVFRGYFLTGLTGVNENFYKFAIAWGITPIVLNGIPPLEYIAYKTPKDSSLYPKIAKLMEETVSTDIKRTASQRRNADQLLAKWRVFHTLWKQEGYDG
jgi:hypothetical protein